MKKDLRNIENSSSFVFDDCEEQEADGGNAMIIRSVRPPSAPESNILSKKRRYATWATDPSQMNADLQSYRNTVSHLQQELRSIESDEDRWLDCFQFASSQLNMSLSSCIIENQKLAVEGKQLQALCIEELGTTSARKKKTTFMHDVVNELDSRRDNLDELFEEYELLLKQISRQAPGLGELVTHIELDEMSAAVVAGAAKPMASTVLGTESKEAENTSSKRALRSSNEKVEVVDDGQEGDILNAYLLMEEQLRVSESILGDVESMWPEEEDPQWRAYPGVDLERSLAEPFTSITTDADWGRLLDAKCSFTSTSDICTRRKRRAEDVIQIRSFVHPRAPRGIPLILSPVGQCGDRYIGKQ